MNFSLHQPSFWVGFITGILFLWLVLKILPLLIPIWHTLIRRIRKIREGLSAGVEIRYRDDLLRHVQKQHLTAPLFSLDEIALEPFFLAPPPDTDFEESTPFRSAASYLIPFLPDWPELGSYLNAPRITLAEILQANKDTISSFVIIGHPGTGKTFALSHLASLVARRETEAEITRNLLPVFIHVADLDLIERENLDPIETLVIALTRITSAFTQPRLTGLLKNAFSDGRVLFLLDGIDELPHNEVDIAVKYLRMLLESYPRIRVIVAASTDYFDGLLELGFAALPIGVWDEYHRRQFISRWTKLWSTHISSHEQPHDVNSEQELTQSWLFDENAAFTPLEFTLKVWAAFAGDILGPNAFDAIEAYIRRITIDKPEARESLEQAASSMFHTSKSFFNPKQLDKPNVLDRIAESGIIIKHTNTQYSIINPEIAGYLAASSLVTNKDLDLQDFSPNWVIGEATANYLAAQGQISTLAISLLTEVDDPLLIKPLKVARWLRHTLQNPTWKTSTLKFMADVIQREKYSLGLRGKAITALATSGVKGVNTLFKQLLNSPDDDIRLLAVFGIGILRDKQMVPELVTMIDDPSKRVSSASVLALFSIHDNKALEGIATALLHGTEEVRRTAAESLARHPAEGYPTLNDGIQNDDLMVRRAVIFGLIQVNQPWSINLLEKIAVEDGQWVVRNAAAQALEVVGDLNPYLPKRVPSDSDNPIFIEFAGEQGIGLSPGKPAADIIVQLLRTGTKEQKLAVLKRLRQHMDARMVPEIYDILYGTSDEQRESAFYTLWLMAAAGIELPSPTQFGLG
jgi:HEAT repeat protein